MKDQLVREGFEHNSVTMIGDIPHPNNQIIYILEEVTNSNDELISKW